MMVSNTSNVKRELCAVVEMTALLVVDVGGEALSLDGDGSPGKD